MTVWVVLGVVLAIVGLPSGLDADRLAAFERLQRHVNEEIVLVDGTGLVMEGRLLAATNTTLDVGFGQHVTHMAADNVARVDRKKDRPYDGLLKGLVIGALLGSLSGNGRWAANNAVSFGALGLVLDLGHHAREPLYRARDPKAPQISAVVSW